MMEFGSPMAGRVRKGFLVLAAGVFAIVAVAACRQAELDRRDAEKRMLTAVAASQAAEATPPPAAAADPPRESEATFEFPVPPERPTEVREYRPPEERREDAPATCIVATAAPTTASAFGRTGEVIQLIVRAHNACPTNFGNVTFRAVAIAPDGREVGWASGQFYGGVPPGSGAETLVVIPMRPSVALTYRAEITGY
jgi:hypothetical protein